MKLKSKWTLLLAIIFSTVLISSKVVAQQEPLNPTVFIEKVANDTFQQITQLRKAGEIEPKGLEKIIEGYLLPHVDHVYTGLLVLGSSANSSEKSDIQAYLDIFKLYLSSTYAASLNYYNEQQVLFEPIRDYKNKDKVSINARVKENGKPDVQMQFKLRLNKEGQWKAYDLVVEGISLVQSKRSEFAPIIRQKGLPGLTQLLKQKVEG